MKTTLGSHFLTVPEIALEIRLKPRTVAHYIRLGKIRAKRVGKKYMCSRDEVEHFMQRGSQDERDFYVAPQLMKSLGSILGNQYQVVAIDELQDCQQGSLSALFINITYTPDPQKYPSLITEILRVTKDEGIICMVAPISFLESRRMRHARELLTLHGSLRAVFELTFQVFQESQARAALIILCRRGTTSRVFFSSTKSFDELQKVFEAYVNNKEDSDLWWWAKNLEEQWSPSYYKPSDMSEGDFVLLKEIAEVKSGFARRWETFNQAQQILYIGHKNIKDGEIDDGEIKKVSVSKNKIEKFALRENDLIVTLLGNLGAVKVPSEFSERCVCSNLTAQLRFKPGIEIDYPELIDYLNGPEARKYFDKVSLGSTVKRVRLGDLAKMPIPSRFIKTK